MSQVALSECHKETDPLYTRNRFCQRFYFLMMEQIHILMSHLSEIVLPLNAHRRYFHPVSVFPVRARSGHLPEIDLRIKVCSERISVVTAIAVQNINGINLVKKMFLRIGTEYLRHSRIKTGTKEGRKSRFLKLLFICPLPGVIKVRRESFLLTSFVIYFLPLRIGNVFRLIVGRIHIVNTAGQAGFHDRQILIRKGNVHNQIRIHFFDQCNHFFCVVCVHLFCGDHCLCLSFHFFLQLITFGLCPAGNTDFLENFTVLTAFLNRHLSDSAASDY